MSTTTSPTPTERQANLIKLASRKGGCTRADVRDELGYGERAAIPVQRILLEIAERFGYAFRSEIAEGERIAHYFMSKAAAKKPARKAAKKGAAKKRSTRKAA